MLPDQTLPGKDEWHAQRVGRYLSTLDHAHVNQSSGWASRRPHCRRMKSKSMHHGMMSGLQRPPGTRTFKSA
jgi:hypothetical protein